MFLPINATMNEKIVNNLAAGDLIAYPTDTVYGVLADATNPAAIAKLYALKARDKTKPLQLLVASMEMAKQLAEFSIEAERLCKICWPGALTLVLPLKLPTLLSPSLYSTFTTVGLRLPNSPQLVEALQLFGKPVAASSVNLAGKQPLQHAADIASTFPNLALIKGETGSIASTVAELKNGKLIVHREGLWSKTQLEEFL